MDKRKTVLLSDDPVLGGSGYGLLVTLDETGEVVKSEVVEDPDENHAQAKEVQYDLWPTQ